MRWLRADDPGFPPVSTAPADAPLAAGGDLHPRRLLHAYSLGIFPWFNEPPILWWSPDPRMMVAPGAVRINRSLAKGLRRTPWRISFDRAFGEVIRACAAPRRTAQGTWLSAEMIAAYEELHRLGFAHSVECWQDTALVGGLYGVALGGAFFGESMFSLTANASKIAFVRLAAVLAAWNFSLIDCQVSSPHMASLGAIALPRETFLVRLRDALDAPTRRGSWHDITESQ
ncbi:MAG: leucyl/phenylalanyl-tRNA--protein transferase [Gammaproteobacteria bacterium]|nr:leucyl/phenylalanyl-tRNA--protein transferase [Gammaproteobacteria bacterium]